MPILRFLLIVSTLLACEKEHSPQPTVTAEENISAETARAVEARSAPRTIWEECLGGEFSACVTVLPLAPSPEVEQMTQFLCEQGMMLYCDDVSESALAEYLCEEGVLEECGDLPSTESQLALCRQGKLRVCLGLVNGGQIDQELNEKLVERSPTFKARWLLTYDREQLRKLCRESDWGACGTVAAIDNIDGVESDAAHRHQTEFVRHSRKFLAER